MQRPSIVYSLLLSVFEQHKVAQSPIFVYRALLHKAFARDHCGCPVSGGLGLTKLFILDVPNTRCRSVQRHRPREPNTP